MGKNIVILIDGTGQDGGPKSTSNVSVLYGDMVIRPDVQVAGYFKGVGTQSDKVAALLGTGMGYGTSNRIQLAYKYLSEIYQEGDKIFLLGFSRGAYTVRSLAGMIHHVGGLLKPEFRTLEKDEGSRQHDFSGREDKELEPSAAKNPNTKHWVVREDDVAYAYTFYSKRNDKKSRPAWSDKECPPTRVRNVGIHFLGVYDTVGALGLPYFNYLSFLNWIPDSFDNYFNGFHDVKLHRGIKIARQALAIDENRQDFAADVWEPLEGVDSEQRWFAGCHSDIGGSYRGAAAQLSNISYIWMTREAEKAGLQLHQLKTNWKEESWEADTNTSFVDSVKAWVFTVFDTVTAWFKKTVLGKEDDPATTSPSSAEPTIRRYELNPYAPHNRENMPVSRNHHYRPIQHIIIKTKLSFFERIVAWFRGGGATEEEGVFRGDQTIAHEVFVRMDTKYTPPPPPPPPPPPGVTTLLLCLGCINPATLDLLGSVWICRF